MFGLKAPLMNKAGEEGGGGGVVDAPPVPNEWAGGLSNVLPKLASGLSFAANPGNIGKAPLAPPQVVDAPAPEGSEINAHPGQATNPATGSSKIGTDINKPYPVVKGPADPKSPIRYVGTFPGTPSPDVAAAMGSRMERINDAEVLQQLAQMRASGVAEDTMRQWYELSQLDGMEARRVYDQHFERARQRVRQLEKDVDDARTLKVNPYNWHEQIGRGGRVSAAFAALTGGFAAGTTSPNTALNLLDAAIERDIAAQETNIKNQFEAMRMAQGLARDERALFTEQMTALSQVRAINYAAALGRIQMAEQNAITAAHRLGLQVAKDHYQLRLLQEIAATQTAIHRLEVDGEVKNARELAQLRSKVNSMLPMIQAGPAGGQTMVQGDVTLDGVTADQVQQAAGERQEVPIQVAPAPGRAAAVASRAPRTGGGGGQPRSAAPGPSSQGEQATGFDPTPQPIEDEDTGMSRRETPEEVAIRKAKFDEAQATAPGAQLQGADVGRAAAHRNVTREEVARALMNNEVQMREDIAKAGGYAKHYLVNVLGAPGNKAPSIDDALNAVMKGRPIPHGGVGLNDDANALKSLIPPPNPKMYKTVKGKYGEVMGAAYNAAKLAYEFGQTNEEIYEMSTSVDGKRNSIPVGNRRFIIRDVARDMDEGTYKEQVEEVQKAATVIDGLQKMSEMVGRSGFDGIFTKDGWTLPGITSANTDNLAIMNAAITQAMGYIKTHDPTARISDKDLEVGREAMGKYLTKGASLLDALQSLDGDVTDNTKRKQIQRFLGALVIEAQRILMRKTEAYFVPDYNTWQQWGQYNAKQEQWIYNAEEGP